MNLQIKNLKVNTSTKLSAGVGDKEILKGVNLEVGGGQVHVVMGPNGSGKSTLAQVIAGHPFYKIVGGSIVVDGKNINKLSPDKRAKLGIFLGFQNPIEIPGVSVFNVMRKAIQGTSKNRKTPVKGQAFVPDLSKLRPDLKLSEFRQQLLEHASSLKLSNDHLSRSFNEGFSGGEKKRNEILQMLALSPKLVILDEIDSGLDVDGLKLVAGAIKKFAHTNRRSSLVIITHYARILKYIKADFVHVMADGRIVKSGKQKLASEIEEKGYEKWQTQSQ
ncbi:MAG: FeS assembly ATPase SufC [Candidatus Curtissbacteria bacterium GW2011_GWA1_40_16]|uniref:FeS assembly ATPase SufC n=1 Tax=Candidatus Curtissbacteria bacterium GW2011_GWA1_40_16 TaxID=1618405 RepID=A0A0G0RF41_9BACT|nr:MAG: FeS assembly ATPase SufC [Candidatus Curtissbacteria bacterium GW2011_GWA1_40_16]